MGASQPSEGVSASSEEARMGWVRGEVVGRGGFGTVHLAMVQGDLRRKTRSEVMAVKSSPLAKSASLDRLSGCPEIVACYGDDVTIEPDGRLLYNLLLEYVSGGSLFGLCCGKPMAEPDVRRYTGCILRGLRYIHAAGYVHCDIKPENILVTGDGQAKIADFGLAKRVGVRLGCGNVSLRGTRLYMAPESVSIGEYEPPVDVWAIGCVVSEMATGIPAWLYGQEDEDTALSRCMPDIPDELSEEGRDFLRRCFIRDTRQRWTVDMLLAHPFVTAAAEEKNRGSQGPTSLCSSSTQLCDILRRVHIHL
uniref:Mitogen-activated protein kinase kinase kinase 3 n=1 Tax=Anthurium amnicola TaxID=1678845 RepID=A0A1D1Y9R9_9ARAE